MSAPWYSPNARDYLAVRASEVQQNSSVRQLSNDDVVAPGDVVWVSATDGQTITLTILHEPVGESCKIKRYDRSTGEVLLVPESGMIDGVANYSLEVMNAVELNSNGADLAVF